MQTMRFNTWQTIFLFLTITLVASLLPNATAHAMNVAPILHDLAEHHFTVTGEVHHVEYNAEGELTASTPISAGTPVVVYTNSGNEYMVSVQEDGQFRFDGLPEPPPYVVGAIVDDELWMYAYDVYAQDHVVLVVE